METNELVIGGLVVVSGFLAYKWLNDSSITANAGITVSPSPQSSQVAPPASQTSIAPTPLPPVVYITTPATQANQTAVAQVTPASGQTSIAPVNAPVIQFATTPSTSVAADTFYYGLSKATWVAAVINPSGAPSLITSTAIPVSLWNSFRLAAGYSMEMTLNPNSSVLLSQYHAALRQAGKENSSGSPLSGLFNW